MCVEKNIPGPACWNSPQRAGDSEEFGGIRRNSEELRGLWRQIRGIQRDSEAIQRDAPGPMGAGPDVVIVKFTITGPGA